MPYVITERWDGAIHPKPSTPERPNPRAAATLDEAQEETGLIVQRDHDAVRRAHDLDEWQPFYDAAGYLPEEGGTVGPLPDGTVIEVTQVSYDELRDDTPAIARSLISAEDDPAILADFNAAQTQAGEA